MLCRAGAVFCKAKSRVFVSGLLWPSWDGSMAQASAEQVKTWNQQLRREGNPFRLRLTSQSPFLYLRGPFQDPPLIRSTGIHHEEANAGRRAYELACELRERGGCLPPQLVPAHQQPGTRFSGWVMLVQATKQELARQGLRSTTAFVAHFNALEQRQGDPSGDAVLTWWRTARWSAMKRSWPGSTALAIGPSGSGSSGCLPPMACAPMKRSIWRDRLMRMRWSRSCRTPRQGSTSPIRRRRSGSIAGPCGRCACQPSARTVPTIWWARLSRPSAVASRLMTCGTAARVAESLGHSETVHRRHYQRWITKAEQKIRARELRRRRLADSESG